MQFTAYLVSILSFRYPFVKLSVLIMFLLNFAYGFIPNILPLVISTTENSSIYLGILKSSIALGSLIGLFFITKYGNNVSRLFKISMWGCALSIGFMSAIHNLYIIIFLFFIYGFCDSITQPLFSYIISSIDERIRGKVIGGIDTIILVSPVMGMFIGTKLMQINSIIAFLYLLLLILL